MRIVSFESEKLSQKTIDLRLRYLPVFSFPAADPLMWAQQTELRAVFADLLETIPARGRRVIEFRFGFVDGQCHTLLETAISMGVSQERIRQIESKALRMLRHPSRSKKLRAFLPGARRQQLEEFYKKPEPATLPEPLDFHARIATLQQQILKQLGPMDWLSDREISEAIGVELDYVKYLLEGMSQCGMAHYLKVGNTKRWRNGPWPSDLNMRKPVYLSNRTIRLVYRD